MKQVLIRLTNLGLRGTTLVSKFLLIFMLARFLEPAELGLYGLLTVSISYGLYFLGFDFYIFTTREILKAEPSGRGQLLKSQVALSLILYAVFLPLTIVLFGLELLPWWLLPWFMALLVLEHITQELNRLLVALRSGVCAVGGCRHRLGSAQQRCPANSDGAGRNRISPPGPSCSPSRARRPLTDRGPRSYPKGLYQ